MVQGKKQLNSKPKFAEVVIGDNEAKEMRDMVLITYVTDRKGLDMRYDIFFRKPTRPSLPLRKGFLKSSRPSLPLKKVPPLISVFSPSGKKRKTALRCSEPLRYKVGGPSKVCAMIVRAWTALLKVDRIIEVQVLW